MLDTYREVVTPEGVALHLPAAGPVPRALAWAIDLRHPQCVALMIAGDGARPARHRGMGRTWC
jgi:hypothetical protein